MDRWTEQDSLRLSVVMGLRKGLCLCRGMRRALTEDEQNKIAREIIKHLGACPDYRSEWTSRRLVMDWLGQVTWFVTPQRCFRPWRRPTAVLRTESACVRA